MGLVDLRLALMTFAQRWDGATLAATALVIPSGDPVNAPLLGAGTSVFAGTSIRLRAGIIGSLDALPALDAGTTVPLMLPAPTNAAELFAHLKAQFAPVDQLGQARAAAAIVRKALPETYTALLAPGARAAANVASAEDFGCTLRAQRPDTTPPPARVTSWGQVISHALRNPFLADALGLRYEFTVGAVDAVAFEKGGWLYVTLDGDDGGTGYAAAWNNAPDAVKAYAARIPALAPAHERQVFTAVLFPVTNPNPKATPQTPDQGEIDLAIAEAEIYDDGFAEMMHARQPDSLDAHIGDGNVSVNAGTDAGIQIGWDDEQVLIWHNRQIAIAAAQNAGLEAKLEAPLGVLGYRVDVREPVPGETPAQRNMGWQSLMEASSTVPPALADTLQAFTGELVIEPTPSSPANVRDFWLPLYFAQWRGTPLGTRDDVPHLLAGGTAAKKPSAIALKPSAYAATAPIRLLYGKTYEFRTRISDLSGGGPKVDDNAVDESVAERTRVAFQRWVAPKGLRVTPLYDDGHAAPRPDRLEIVRPRMGYPEALFTSRYGNDPAVADATVNALLAQLGMQPDGTPPPAPPPKNDIVAIGVPDPDVTKLEITVEVRSLAHDTGGDATVDGFFDPVYTTTRPVPPLPPIPVDPTLTDVVADTAIPPLELRYIDVDDIGVPLVIPANGPLPIPRSRDVRITITPIAEGPAGYFGTFPASAARVPVTRGTTSHLLVRAPALAEPTPLFAPLPNGQPLAHALYFQPHTDGDPVAALMGDLAERLDVHADGLTLRARPGERVVFFTTGFKAAVAADGGSITFASAAELFRNWCVVLQARLARDWTWDGLADAAIHVELAGSGGAPDVAVGTIPLPHIASAEAVAGTPDRTTTRLVFFHAIDPSVPNAHDGFTAREPYRLRASVRAEAGPPLDLRSAEIALRLPVAAIPAGVPKLASAGYALSAYVAAPDYSATMPRHRQLWIEISEPPAPGDALFVRLLGYAPDPLLYTDNVVRETKPSLDPPLKLDPELMRVITPGQSRDEDGIEAMTELHDALPDDPLKYLLPLPAGVDENDPRLFGMWTYELRFGHKKPWSLAHARFGRPLRVTGVQHPAPTLPCVASWRRVSPLLDQPAAFDEATILLRTSWEIVATAPFATPVFENGEPAGTGMPYSTIGFLLYAQARQADGSGNRNVLLTHQGATPFEPRQTRAGIVYSYGSATFAQNDIRTLLRDAGLPENAPLSVLAVEFYPPGGVVAEIGLIEQFGERGGGRPAVAVGPFDPFAPPNFGKRRIVRTSPLTKVQPYC